MSTATLVNKIANLVPQMLIHFVAFGGSTCVILFEKGRIVFDEGTRIVVCPACNASF